MTIDQFLVELAKTTNEYNWTTTQPPHMRVIRGTKGLKCYCPVLAVAFHKKVIDGYCNNFQYTKAGQVLGLAYQDIHEIVNASDGVGGALRTKILKALKLKDLE